MLCLNVCCEQIGDVIAPKNKIHVREFRTELCDVDHKNDRLFLNNVNVFTKDNGDIGVSGVVNTTTFLYSPFKVTHSLLCSSSLFSINNIPNR